MQNGRTKILEAICDEDLEQVRERAQKYPSEVSIVDEDGIAPLHACADDSTIEIGKILIACGADVNVHDSGEATPLHYAAQNRALKMARLLIQHGAFIDAKRADGVTPLYLATGPTAEAQAVASLLIDSGAKIDLNSALRLRMFDRVREILSSEPDAVKQTPFPKELLVDAVNDREGFEEIADILELLLQNGAEVDGESYAGETALMIASQRHGMPIEVFKVLLDHGADASARDPVQKRSVIQLASYFENRAAVELIQQYLSRGETTL